ncbi:MAG: hypothetical protein UU72_C0038G0005 [candidate division WWE3 bacterium GW2011_GWB1_41_6]|uniref:N(4)-bis(aminopropyl)spermidine synthase C-terminal domain-containing protein n=1 Tax=candidate division WWE3 bacterium GW2011_GWB1_41_6 TaxID=1619112 RepID=A0A0G0WQT5_UNCKA|nr:MAG: hypothetical protein UU72_C0038G0005 [candidate division WWE3 bacterium GW2011_GWB1_41_6]
MNDLVQKIKINNSDLKIAEIKGILKILSDNSVDITNSELIRLTGFPKETLRNFKSSISSLLENSDEDSIRLKPAIVEEIKKLDLRPHKWKLYSYEQKDLEDRLLEIRKTYELEPKREYDQFFATANTSVAKALVLRDKGLISGKNIALLGDDDLVSIVLGLMNEDHLNVTVFDIDDEILAVIERISKDLNLKNIRTVKWDVRTKLNPQFMSAFDVMMTDPPYTRNGIALFLNAGVELLGQNKGHAGKYIFLFYGNSFKSPEKTLKVQEVIADFNMVIEDKIDKFARYYGAESIGSASSLYILKATPFTHPLEEVLLTRNIYTFEEQKEEKFPFVDHYTFKIHNVPRHIVGSKKAILKVAGDFANAHRLKVLDTKVTQFRGKGLTITFVLGSSNLLLHTWPEFNAVHMDLITCSPIYNKEMMADSVVDLFKTDRIEIRRIE